MQVHLMTSSVKRWDPGKAAIAGGMFWLMMCGQTLVATVSTAHRVYEGGRHLSDIAGLMFAFGLFVGPFIVIPLWMARNVVRASREAAPASVDPMFVPTNDLPVEAVVEAEPASLNTLVLGVAGLFGALALANLTLVLAVWTWYPQLTIGSWLSMLNVAVVVGVGLVAAAWYGLE